MSGGSVSHGPANLYNSSGNRLASLELGSSWVLEVAIVDGSGNQITTFGSATADNIATNQISISSNATIIVSSRDTRNDVAIVNISTANIYLGSSTITSTSGVLLVGTPGAAVVISNKSAIYGITTAGSYSVSYLEDYS